MSSILLFCNTNATWFEKYAIRVGWRKSYETWADTKDDSTRQSRYVVTMYWNTSQCTKVPLFFFHILFCTKKELNSINSNAQNMHWFWEQRRQIKQFRNHIFSFQKYETVVQQTNVNEGKTCKTDRHSQKNIQHTHTHMHTLTFLREITTVLFFSVQSLVLFRHFSKHSVRSHSSANKRKF